MIATIRYRQHDDALYDVVFLCAAHDIDVLLPSNYARVESSKFEAECKVCEFQDLAPSEAAAIRNVMMAEARAVADKIDAERKETARMLRETAMEIRQGKINPQHVANRLAKRAREIDPEGEGK